MRISRFAQVLGLFSLWLVVPSASRALDGCEKDTDCKGDRICDEGKCVAPVQPICSLGPQSLAGEMSQVKADEARDLVRQIMEKAFLSNEFDMHASPGINNAGAMLRGGKRLIIYDPIFLEKLNQTAQSRWAAIFVFAHEVGHHVEGHTAASSCSHDNELQADAFATRVLRAMGASLSETKAGMSALPSSGGQCHPSSADRTKKIEEVYKKQTSGNSTEQPKDPTPPVTAPPNSNPTPPAGFPRGTITLPCGCHGFVNFGATRANQFCASGFDEALACQAMCPLGGLMWGARCT